jgi:hypothetical protein
VTGLAEPQPAPAVTGPATIRVIAQRLQTARIDVGRSGQSPGDLEVATSLVYNMRVTPRSIGRFELTCTFVRGVSRVCQGTLRLPKGDIVVGGSMRYQSLFELAVLGGTGLYDNGRGTLTVTRLGTGPTRDLLLVRLLG